MPCSRPPRAALLYSAGTHSDGGTVMIQTLAIALLLVPAQAEKTEKKPSYIGVQIHKADDGSIRVMATLPDSPARKAELLTGDVLVKIDGVKPPDLPTAVKLIQSLTPGKKVKFLIKREGKEKEIDV